MIENFRLRAMLLAAAITVAAGSAAHAGWTLAVPGPLTAAPTASDVALTWTNVSGETGFVVERRLAGSASFSESPSSARTSRNTRTS